MNTPTFFSLLKKSRYGIPIMRDSNPMLDQQRLKRKMKERRLKILGKKKTNGNGKKKK
jgi:hypothetical protein